MTSPSTNFVVPNARFEQMFPTLTGVEIARMGKFGEPRRYRDRERIVESGKPGAGMIVAVDTSDEKLELAKQFGATHGYNVTGQANAGKDLFKLTGGGALSSRERPERSMPW